MLSFKVNQTGVACSRNEKKLIHCKTYLFLVYVSKFSVGTLENSVDC